MAAVRRVAVGEAAARLAEMERVDYSDAFEVDVDPTLPDDPEFWRLRLLSDESRAMRIAMGLRNAFAKRVGLVAGELADVPVLARTEHELVTGLDDRHLDFRLVVGVRRADARLTVRATTLVRFNGSGGRLYFTPVKPVHRHLVMPGMLRRAARTQAPPTVA